MIIPAATRSSGARSRRSSLTITSLTSLINCHHKFVCSPAQNSVNDSYTGVFITRTTRKVFAGNEDSTHTHTRERTASSIITDRVTIFRCGSTTSHQCSISRCAMRWYAGRRVIGRTGESRRRDCRRRAPIPCLGRLPCHLDSRTCRQRLLHHDHLNNTNNQWLCSESEAVD